MQLARCALLRTWRPYRGRPVDGPSSCVAATTREAMMRQNDEITRLPPGYTLDLLGDPCVIVVRRADGTVVVRFTKHDDPEQIRRAAAEDHRGPAGS